MFRALYQPFKRFWAALLHWQFWMMLRVAKRFCFIVTFHFYSPNESVSAMPAISLLLWKINPVIGFERKNLFKTFIFPVNYCRKMLSRCLAMGVLLHTLWLVVPAEGCVNQWCEHQMVPHTATAWNIRSDTLSYLYIPANPIYQINIIIQKVEYDRIEFQRK